MKRIDYYEMISKLFEFKTIRDENGTEYVLFSYCLDSMDIPDKTVCINSANIPDKTAFEALENHTHLLDNLTKEEFERLIPVAQNLGKSLLNNLICNFPEKHFIVYVSIQVHDSMIIRFHQKWENEPPYYNPADFNSPTERVCAFEN